MSSTTERVPGSGDWIDQLAVHHQRIAMGLLGLGLALTAIPIANASLYKAGSLTTLIWGVALALHVLTIGVVYAIPPVEGSPPRNQPNTLRMVLLGVAGGAGLLTALYGLALALSSPPYFASVDYREVFAGGIPKWRDPANGYQNAWALTRCLAAVLGGLVLMFAGLQLARTFERTSQGLRRLLYGYNAVLSSLLIGFILLLINVMSYTNVWPLRYLGMTYDWTGSKMYSLSDSTQNLLSNLKEPVKVYLLLSSRNVISLDAEVLLNTCHQVTDELTWESLSPEANRFEIIKLMQKYGLQNIHGMLVVYGKEPNQTWDFTPDSELVGRPDPTNPQRYVFKGEEYLQKSLLYLTQDKNKTHVYFVQGHGEADPHNQDLDPMKGGIGRLVEDLRKRSYEIHDLKLGPRKHEIPRDADIVVIVDPHQPYSSEEVSALRDYLQGKGPSGKKGHLMVLFDVHVSNGKMAQTGLESLMAENGVRLENDRLLNVQSNRERMYWIQGVTDPRSNNPIGRSFSNQRNGMTIFLFEDVRSVDSLGSPTSTAKVEPLVFAPGPLLLRQTDLSESPETLIQYLTQHVDELKKRILEEPPSLAVAVSEGNPLARIPGHESMAGEGEKPRMVVFGDSTWVTNRMMTGGQGLAHGALFASCLAWLKQRPDIGTTVTNHEREYFRLNIPSGLARLRLVILPICLLLVAVVGMGLGVWVIRRR